MNIKKFWKGYKDGFREKKGEREIYLLYYSKRKNI